jgi:Fe-Mn family superoxide dismutase
MKPCPARQCSNRSRRKIAQIAPALRFADARAREFFAIALEPLTADRRSSLVAACWLSKTRVRKKPMPFTLPDLPYAYDALAPFMSRETLEYHHDKHHKAYVDTANKLMQGGEWEAKPVEDVVKGTFGKNAPLFNNAAQHYNHTHFWKWMKPGGGGHLPGSLEKRIVADLGSVDKMKEDLVQAGVGQFGSGWCWLAVKDGKIVVMKTPNGENPLVHGATPILGCDVWEHSYYIDYRNRRPDYLKAFLDHLVNWEHVAHMLDEAGKKKMAA